MALRVRHLNLGWRPGTVRTAPQSRGTAFYKSGRTFQIRKHSPNLLGLAIRWSILGNSEQFEAQKAAAQPIDYLAHCVAKYRSLAGSFGHRNGLFRGSSNRLIVRHGAPSGWGAGPITVRIGLQPPYRTASGLISVFWGEVVNNQTRPGRQQSI